MASLATIWKLIKALECFENAMEENARKKGYEAGYAAASRVYDEKRKSILSRDNEMKTIRLDELNKKEIYS